MAGFEHYISVGKERLRCGYTTGTCAAAAARGAAERLLTGVWPGEVEVDTPAGIPVRVELEDCSAGPDWASCAVRKDGGDDADATHGLLIFARVEKLPHPGVEIDGGEGVGRVTRPGLDQPPGEAAINSTPRRMIETQLREAMAAAGTDGGLKAMISVPEGERIAKRTFNPRLGIEGGISILGTSGIVRPMSEAALIDSVKLELDILRARGVEDVLVTPGNYGEDFSRDILHLDLTDWALCSNYVGESIDHAAGLGFRSFLLVGHLGKLIKVAAGTMNTHSKTADGRREVLCTHAALCGADRDTVQALYGCLTTDQAIPILDGAGLREPVLRSIAAALDEQLKHRAGDMRIEALFFSNQYGVLGQTPGAAQLIAIHRNEEEPIL